MGLFAAAAIAAVGSAAGAYMQDKATQKSIDAQRNALNNLQYLDINTLSEKAKLQDLSKYQSQFDAQSKYDPNSAEMRTRGAYNINSILQQDASGTTSADQDLAKANAAADLSNSQNAAVIQGLIDQAKKDLAAGASMPPEFEAQLVQAGLEKAGGTGYLAGTGATGSTARQLLGSKGIALQQSRAAEAQNLANTAGGLQNARQATLSNLVTLDNNLRGAKMSRAQTGYSLGMSTVPSIGLSGADVTNMSIANTNQRNKAILGQGALNAQSDLSTGQMYGKMIGAGTSLVSGMAGGGFGSLLGTGNGGGQMVYNGSILQGLLGGGSKSSGGDLPSYYF